jgi:KaiC/GvpD/RAD55 family RecA-like ATPase
MLAEGIRVSKSNPCPVCHKTDWCYTIGSGDTSRVLCTRLKRDSLLLPDYLEETDTTDKEGFPFLKLKIEEKAPRPDKTIEYIYTRDSIPVLKVVTKYANGKKQGVYPYLWSEGQWNMRSGLGDIPETSFPLFNQDAVIATDKTVFLVEGESCAKALNGLGFVATTIRGKTFSKEHLDILRSKRQIVLCPDRDTTGVEFMAKAYLLLSESKTPMKQLLAPPHAFFWQHLPSSSGLDVVDWINTGVDRDAIIKAVEPVGEVITGIADNTAPDVTVESHTALDMAVKLWMTESNSTKQVLMRNQICKEFKIDKDSFLAVLKGLITEMSTTKPTCKSGAEFMAEGDKEIEWLLSNLIAKGEMILLSGMPGGGKTVLAMFLIHKFLREQSQVFNETVMKSCKVMFISGDQSDRTTRKRFSEMGTDNILEFGNNLRIVSNFGLESLDFLESELQNFRPDFVVVDSLTSITMNSGIAEKDPEFAYGVYRLKNLFSQYDVGSILIHHLNKSGTESGSLRILAAVWAVWRIEPSQPDNPNCTTSKITMPKVRDSERMTLEIKHNPVDEWQEKGVFTFLGEAESGLILSDILSRAMSVMRELGEVPTDELAHKVNTNIGTLRTTLNRAKNRGLVESTKTTSRVGTWKLTELAQKTHPKPAVTAQPRLPPRYPNMTAYPPKPKPEIPPDEDFF